MRTILIATASAILMAMPAAKADEMCESVADFAETVMTERQNGVEKDRMLAAIEATDVNADYVAMASGIISLAYDEPHYYEPGTPLRREQTMLFRAKIYLDCTLRSE